MKLLGILFILTTLAACDPYGFGFKHNPAYVLKEAVDAIKDLDEEKFIDATGKEALCIYANSAGLTYLRDRVVTDSSNVELKPKKLNSVYYKSPQFVDYWSYYNETYLVDIIEKSSKSTLLQVVFECDYGSDKDKHDKWLNLRPSKYKKKMCRLTKIVPKKVDSLPLPARCEFLKVNIANL